MPRTRDHMARTARGWSPAKVLERINAAQSKAVAQLAERVRRTHVQPICDKYNLHFVAGNGTWIFFSKTNEKHVFGVLDVKEARSAGYGLKRIIKTLSTQVDHWTDLGDHVGDCAPRTRKRISK